MASRILQVCICLLMMCLITTIFRGTVRATGIIQSGPGKPQNCNAIPFSSTAVLLTWDSPSGIQNNGNFSIHYRALYSKGSFTVLRVGAASHKLIENLDVITYYAFRIVAKDRSGKHDYCEVLAKTMRDALLSVRVQARPAPRGSRGLIVEWSAVTLQDAQPIYRLFMEWRHGGRIHVRLLYEGNHTSCKVKGKLPTPHLMYVSVIPSKRVHTDFLAANLHSYPTKKPVLIPVTGVIPSKPGNETNI
ncbi:Immunoglobulin C-2 Type [Desmophyllum pertusum]|uniref:Immunoglobulin C-2 Type n=1 Tax=Desmophyllum pertusum TaxID=174260 RepID=A0A9W9ZM03_9CNID|nr:Immunoglobulin C-2 Type [Desmophyllum pertusum]